MRDDKKTKNLLTQTALSLFVEKGITETTVRDIAQAAGVAEGTLYRHFVSKDDLAWELFSENFTAFAHELEQLAALNPTLSSIAHPSFACQESSIDRELVSFGTTPL